MILLDYAYFSRGAKGFRIAITDSRDKPIVEQNGFLVAPGSETLIAMVPTILSTTDEALQFKPEDRNCYTSEEVDLKYFRRSKGYKYSMQNCLYESVLESILDQCSCIPNFMSFKLENITYSVCRGTDLDCALEKIQNMGNEKLNLTTAMDTNDNSIKCLQNCELQEQNLIQTSSDYPNWQTFPDRVDFCLILKKVVKVCKDDIRKLGILKSIINISGILNKILFDKISALEKRYKDLITCDEILKYEADLNVARCEGRLDTDPYDSNDEKMSKFLNDYARKNIAILKIFLKDPYYTNVIRDRQITLTNFVGNTGGLVGLCLGLSGISIFEAIYHIFNLIVKSCSNK